MWKVDWWQEQQRCLKEADIRSTWTSQLLFSSVFPVQFIRSTVGILWLPFLYRPSFYWLMLPSNIFHFGLILLASYSAETRKTKPVLCVWSCDVVGLIIKQWPSLLRRNESCWRDNRWMATPMIVEDDRRKWKDLLMTQTKIAQKEKSCTCAFRAKTKGYERHCWPIICLFLLTPPSLPPHTQNLLVG